MVGSETPKIRETSLRGIPRSQAASILSLRSFEYGFMPAVLHADQSLRKSLLERRLGELLRITHPRTPVNKGLGSLVCRLTPEPGGPSGHHDSPSYWYKLAYSIPGAYPYHHLPQEAPRLHTPVHVPTHVAPKARVLPALQVRVPHNQGRS